MIYLLPFIVGACFAAAVIVALFLLVRRTPVAAQSSGSSDLRWMLERFPIGARVDYLNRVLSVGRHDNYGSWCGALCEYVDDSGRIREVTLNSDQLRAIAARA